MNKASKKIVALSLLTIFSLAVGLLCSYGYDLYAQDTDPRENNTETFHAVITGSLPGGAVQPEKQLSVAHSNAVASGKLFTEQLALLRSADHSIPDPFAHYSSASANLPARLSRGTIIFPFHYFW